MKNYRVVNSELFNSTVNELDLSLRADGFGDVEINGKTSTGYHGFDDYLSEYGFIIEDPKYMIIDETAYGCGKYIDKDGHNCELQKDAALYDTELCAKDVIESNNWHDWASVVIQMKTCK